VAQSNPDIQVYLGKPYPEKMVAYKSGNVAHVLKVSTGRPGYETPPAHYKVIAKNDTAFSSKYKSPMEFALRIAQPGGSYTGLNIHQEKVPDVPASHGCIRTHFKSAIIMFEMFVVGSTVSVVSDGAPASLNFTADYSTGNYTRDWFEVGDDDDAVKVVQRQLVYWKYLTSGQVSGVYDDATSNAVYKYQQDHHLPADGKAGDATMQAMMAYLNRGF